MIQQLITAISAECRLIFRNREVILILLLAPLIYAMLYSFGYSKEVLYKLPVAIIDHSQSHSSRTLTTKLTASPYILEAYSPTDIESAKKLLLERKIYGIIEIPQSYATEIMRGMQGRVAIYCDASYFLMYRQMFQGVMNAIPTHTSVTTSIHTLFNPSLGYGSFIMPAILILILQQTALMGIGIVGAIGRKRNMLQQSSAATILIAKILTYSAIYTLLMSYIFGLHYRLFGYPQHGSAATCIAILTPYALSFILLGIALSTLYKRPETPLLTTMWSSIPLLLISGASLPAEAFPAPLYALGKLSPSSSAISAYIRAQSMGATIADISAELITLWVLTLIYGTAAYLGIKKASGRTTKFRMLSNNSTTHYY